MTLINDFLSLIYPRHCESCGNNLFRHEQYICNYCRLHLPRSNYHLHSHHELMNVFAGRVPLVAASCLFLYEKRGRVQKILHAIKYHAQTELAEFLGNYYGTMLNESGHAQNCDVLLPIPLHPKKLKKRGFNQSEHYSKGLSQSLRKPMDITSMERTRDTATQTKKKKYQRWENVEGIFRLRKGHGLENKHVLLVDDVVTTGATIEAAWLALKDVSGIKVSVVSIAFASRNSF